MQNKGPILYGVSSTGVTRTWQYEVEKNFYRTHYGQEGGTITTSEWTECRPTNRGRSNARTGEEQAVFEAEALLKKKLDQGFSLNRKNTGKKYFAPMLAKKYTGFKGTVLSQPKLNGIRCIATRKGMMSRRGKPIISAPHIHEHLKGYFDRYPHHILDGELYSKVNFETILSCVRKEYPTEEDLLVSRKNIQFWVYDGLTSAHDKDPWGVRMYNLKLVRSKILKIVPTHTAESEEELDSLYEEYIVDGYEGQMVRSPTLPYQSNKRSPGLLKRKNWIDKEFTIEAIHEGNGNWRKLAKSLTIRVGKKSQECAIRGDKVFAAHLLKYRQSYIGTEVTVRFQEYTVNNKLRTPVAIVFWKGKRDL